MTLWFHAADGVRLAADSHGPDDGLPVLMLGGLGQTRHSWERAARQVGAGGRRAITLDIRGHGESDRAPDGDYRYPSLIADLCAVIQTLGRPAVLVGASLGGKISLAAAGYGGPHIACGLVLVDTVPRTVPAGVATVTQALRPPPEGFDSLDAAAWSVARLRGEEPEPGAGERLRRNMRLDERGRWHWHWDRAFSERDQGLGRDAGLLYLETAAARVTVPMLIARGELSNVVDAAGVAALCALAPHAEVEVIGGARHMLVGDQNDAFADALNRFLDRTPGL